MTGLTINRYEYFNFSGHTEQPPSRLARRTFGRTLQADLSLFSFENLEKEY